MLWKSLADLGVVYRKKWFPFQEGVVLNLKIWCPLTNDFLLKVYFNFWTKGLICKFLKKGNLQECGNWRGVTLLPLASKVLSRIIINRIQAGVDRTLRKEQAGFRRGWGTVDQISSWSRPMSGMLLCISTSLISRRRSTQGTETVFGSSWKCTVYQINWSKWFKHYTKTSNALWLKTMRPQTLSLLWPA